MSTVLQKGSSSPVEIEVDAIANENGLAFSLSFDQSKLDYVSTSLVPGLTFASLNINTSLLASGRVGIAFALPAGQALSSGTQRVVSVSFAPKPSASPGASGIGFVDTPVLRELVDTAAATLPVAYVDGTIAIAPSYEGDTAPRPYGNGALTVTDWVQTGRLAIGLDLPASASEFQRADCAPRETAGNGVLSLADWVQAGRYTALLDPITEAAGPTSASGFAADTFSDIEAFGLQFEMPRLGRTVLLTEMASSSERTFVIELIGRGDENAIAFSLHLPTSLRLTAAKASEDSATLHVNASVATQLGIALAMPPGQPFRGSTLLTLTFDGNGEPSFMAKPVAGELITVGADEVAVVFASESRQLAPRKLR